MSDNVAYTPGTGATIAADDVGGVLYQRAKLVWGVDGVVVDASDSNPLPVTVSGVSTSAKQDTGNTSLSSIDGKIVAVNTGAVVVASGSLTANAGTNLNTSLLALEAGGNLATIAGKDFATSAKQDTGNSSLASIAAEDFATETSLAKLTQAQGAAASSLVGPMVQAVVNDAPQVFLPDELRPLSLNTEGRLRVVTVAAPIYLEHFVGSNHLTQPPGLTSAENLWQTDSIWA